MTINLKAIPYINTYYLAFNRTCWLTIVAVVSLASLARAVILISMSAWRWCVWAMLPVSMTSTSTSVSATLALRDTTVQVLETPEYNYVGLDFAL